jgi:ribonuclease P protein component
VISESRASSERESPGDEADVPAERAPAGEDARVPRANEDAGRKEGPEAPAGEGAEAVDGLTGRFTRRERLGRGAEFQAVFQQGKRIDRPSLVVLWRASDSPSRVGFAVSRQVRGAVKRNRVRRRLREAYRIARAAAPGEVAMVVVGRTSAMRVGFMDLVGEVRDALAAIPGRRAT